MTKSIGHRTANATRHKHISPITPDAHNDIVTHLATSSIKPRKLANGIIDSSALTIVEAYSTEVINQNSIRCILRFGSFGMESKQKCKNPELCFRILAF